MYFSRGLEGPSLQLRGPLCSVVLAALPRLYGLRLLPGTALLLGGLPVAARLLHVGQHVGHERLLQPLPHAVHQLLLFPAHTHTGNRAPLTAGALNRGGPRPAQKEQGLLEKRFIFVPFHKGTLCL